MVESKAARLEETKQYLRMPVDLGRWVGVFRRKAIRRFVWFQVRSIEDGQAVRYLASKLELLEK